jgi:sulfite reductase (NADPH) flavoprotein alpha-component
MVMTSGRVDEYTSPLNREQAEHLNRLMENLSPGQMTWISGYLAGINAVAGQNLVPSQTLQSAVQKAEQPAITLLFGSQTGNGEKIAEEVKARAEAKGFQVAVKSMGEYKKNQLKKDKNLLLFVSTHGEGDPPDDAQEFHEFLLSEQAPRLEGMRFSVLALGDSSYEQFCQTGKEFDARLEALGAVRLYDRVDCDVDYEELAEVWIEGVLEKLSEQLVNLDSETAVSAVTAVPSAGAVIKSIYSRKNPFPATVLNNINLNGRGSVKETRHIELSIEDSGLDYEPGDSLGIMPCHRPEQVIELIQRLGLAENDSVNTFDGNMTLDRALTHHYEITTITRPFLEKYAAVAESSELSALFQDANREALSQFIAGRHVIDVLETYPIAGLTAQQFIDMLRKLPPRLYSIASSHKANPGEVHLTVAVVRYESFGRQREGLASTYLADRIAGGETVPVYIDTNKNFKLPKDPDAPVIMIGPGTGVAPFRAFLQEREELEATGNNWLFFGDQHFTTDFLYQIEWLRYRKAGLLNAIEVAFSRDQSEKVYVQQRMWEKRKAFFAWLEEGAHLYVCGDATRMAPDVHNTLLKIIQTEGGLSEERAMDYLKSMQRDKRYQRDVY